MEETTTSAGRTASEHGRRTATRPFRGVDVRTVAGAVLLALLVAYAAIVVPGPLGAVLGLWLAWTAVVLALPFAVVRVVVAVLTTVGE